MAVCLFIATGVSLTGVSAAAADQSPGVVLSVPGGTADLRQYRIGAAYLAPHNNTGSAVTITEIKVFASLSLSVCPAFKPDGSPAVHAECSTVKSGDLRNLAITIGPGDTAVLPFGLHVGDQVEEGPSTVLFQANYIDPRGSVHVTDLASYTVKLSTLGTSGVLDVMKVPSFLFLPGFLVLLIFYWLSAIGTRPDRPRPNLIEELSPGKPQAWALGVLLSFGAIPLYPVITGRFGPPRSYLGAYGLRDLVYVWVGSLAFGVLLAVVYLAGDLLLRDRVNQYVSERTPLVGDVPLEVLRKMGVRTRWWHGGVPFHKGLWYQQVLANVGDEALLVFKLADVAGTPGNSWIVPAIDVARLELTPEDWASVHSAADRDDVRSVVETLERTPEAVAWANLDREWPQLVPTGSMTTSGGLGIRRIVQER